MLWMMIIAGYLLASHSALFLYSMRLKQDRWKNFVMNLFFVVPVIILSVAVLTRYIR